MSATMKCHVKSQVEAKGQPSVGGAVSHVEVIVYTCSVLWHELTKVGGAEVRTHVNQEAQLTDLVCDEEAAGGCNADVRRR
jgi:hypothetical protein